jgi:hypothetical protein
MLWKKGVATMTEAEWLEGRDPALMLEFLRDKSSDRKLKLFAVACCRRIEWILADSRSRQAMVAAEGCAEQLDPKGTRGALKQARRRALAAHTLAGSVATQAIVQLVKLMDGPAWCGGVEKVARAVASAALEEGLSEWDQERVGQAALVRDLFGNPFRPVVLDPGWLTPTVSSIAKRVDEERDFEALPILADALEDAGCADAVVLNHCREPGVHFRGCWLIDHLLHRE